MRAPALMPATKLRPVDVAAPQNCFILDEMLFVGYSEIDEKFA